MMASRVASFNRRRRHKPPTLCQVQNSIAAVHWQPVSRVASAPAGNSGRNRKREGERQMAIHLVTHRKGGSREEVAAVVSRLKAATLRSGAEDFRLSVEIAGPPLVNGSSSSVSATWHLSAAPSALRWPTLTFEQSWRTSKRSVR